MEKFTTKTKLARYCHLRLFYLYSFSAVFLSDYNGGSYCYSNDYFEAFLLATKGVGGLSILATDINCVPAIDNKQYVVKK